MHLRTARQVEVDADDRRRRSIVFSSSDRENSPYPPAPAPRKLPVCGKPGMGTIRAVIFAVGRPRQRSGAPAPPTKNGRPTRTLRIGTFSSFDVMGRAPDSPAGRSPSRVDKGRPSRKGFAAETSSTGAATRREILDGPWAGLTGLIGLSWLALLLRIDAFISPSGTGLIYTTGTSRVSYGLSRNRYFPQIFGKVDKNGVPWVGRSSSSSSGCSSCCRSRAGTRWSGSSPGRAC